MLQKIMKSKLMNLALVVEILAVIQLNADFLSTILTPNQFGWVMLIIAMLIRIFRVYTDRPLSEK